MFAVVASALMFSGCFGPGDDRPPLDYISFPETAEFTIERKLSLQSLTAPVPTYNISIPKPFHIPDLHEVLDLATSPEPTSTRTYRDQEWMEWEGTISRGDKVTITITYDMKLYSTLWEIDASDSATIDDIPKEYRKYLGDEWVITPSDPQVKDLAETIVGSQTNVYQILVDIFKWIWEHIDYNFTFQEPKTCAQTLASGEGNSSDQSVLFASLARAAGVPVWLNLGLAYDPIREFWDRRCWTNVFVPLEDGDWLIGCVDISNHQFLFRDPYHVSDFISNGDGDDLEEYFAPWKYVHEGPGPEPLAEETIEVVTMQTSGFVQYFNP